MTWCQFKLERSIKPSLLDNQAMQNHVHLQTLNDLGDKASALRAQGTENFITGNASKSLDCHKCGSKPNYYELVIMVVQASTVCNTNPFFHRQCAHLSANPQRSWWYSFRMASSVEIFSKYFITGNATQSQLVLAYHSPHLHKGNNTPN